MYGQFQCVTSDGGVFGQKLCIGHTLGEEVLFRKPITKGGKKLRSESVIAKAPSCVLQISTRSYKQLLRLKDRTQPNGLAQRDYELLK